MNPDPHSECPGSWRCKWMRIQHFILHALSLLWNWFESYNLANNQTNNKLGWSWNFNFNIICFERNLPAEFLLWNPPVRVCWFVFTHGFAGMFPPPGFAGMSPPPGFAGMSPPPGFAGMSPPLGLLYIPTPGLIVCPRSWVSWYVRHPLVLQVFPTPECAGMSPPVGFLAYHHPGRSIHHWVRELAREMPHIPISRKIITFAWKTQSFQEKSNKIGKISQKLNV